MAVEQIATSGRSLDVLVGPAGTGKSTTMAGLRAVWEAEHGAGSVLGLAPSAAAAEVLAGELGIDTENTAKWLYEHRQEAERLSRLAALRRELRSAGASERRRSPVRRRIAAAEAEVARWRLRRGQLVIVEEATLAGTFALDELVTAAGDAGAKVLLVGDQAQLSAVEAGGMFAALVRDRNGLAPELSDVRRFHNVWEQRASVELRAGSEEAIDAYEAHDRIVSGRPRRDARRHLRGVEARHRIGTHEPDDRGRSGHRERAQRPGPGRPDLRRAGDRRGRHGRRWRNGGCG